MLSQASTSVILKSGWVKRGIKTTVNCFFPKLRIDTLAEKKSTTWPWIIIAMLTRAPYNIQELDSAILCWDLTKTKCACFLLLFFLFAFVIRIKTKGYNAKQIALNIPQKHCYDHLSSGKICFGNIIYIGIIY